MNARRPVHVIGAGSHAQRRSPPPRKLPAARSSASAIRATVISGVTVGAWAMVGASAAVIRNVPAGITFAGVPARLIETRSR
jgi:hypothetical protein